jgi:hypothetical protein
MIDRPETGELIATLRERGLLRSDTPLNLTADSDRPWFVSLMTGVAGWLAGIFLLGFIGLTLELDSSVTIFVIGVVLLAVAWMMYRADRQLVFLDQLALALSIAGQFAVAWALLDDAHSAFVMAGTILLLQLVVFALMPNRAARTIAALFAVLAWVYTVHFLLHPGNLESLFWERREAVRTGFGWSLAGWLLTWVPPLALTWVLTTRESHWMANAYRDRSRPLLSGLLVGIAIGGLAAYPLTSIVFGSEAIGIGMNWYALFPLLAIAMAVFAAYCAFQLRNLGLLGFAILAALVHLSKFYFLYGTSLTWKAVIMACLGVAMLGAGLLARARAAREVAP